MAYTVFMDVLWVLNHLTSDVLPVVAHRSWPGLGCTSGEWQQTAG